MAVKLRLREPQGKVFGCSKRFRLLVAGRRFGKTYLALVELCRAAWAPRRTAWYVGPTYKQAKRIAWKALKQMTKPYWRQRPNETDLTIELSWGATISLRGADHYDSLRGEGLDFMVLDEYASMAPEAWTQVLRPALSDKIGKALFIGTPRGFNHFYDLFAAARTQPDWAAFQFTTEEGGNVPAEELESAARELDERTYRQEFQASFENLTSGRAYYAFDRNWNVQILRYDPTKPLIWSLDFNVNPMCSILAQQVEDHIHILAELVLPDSNTVAACEAFLERTEPWQRSHPLPVFVYGDATGNSRKSAASRTDWQLVKDFIGRYTHSYRASMRVPNANPPLKDRLNCVNALLCNHAGERRLLVDPHCKHLIRDFEQVCWKTDLNGNPVGELDPSDPTRTHVSDAVGYYIVRQFPMRARVGYY